MPRVSRYSLPHREEKQLSEQFSTLISSLHNQKHIQQFLDEFLTFEEKNMLSKRLALFVLLSEHIPSDMIQAKLSLSRETVRIYHQQFPSKSSIFHKTISHFIRVGKMKHFISNAADVVDTLMTAKTNMKSRAKLISGSLK